jgi:hypothetical protein
MGKKVFIIFFLRHVSNVLVLGAIWGMSSCHVPSLSVTGEESTKSDADLSLDAAQQEQKQYDAFIPTADAIEPLEILNDIFTCTGTWTVLGTSKTANFELMFSEGIGEAINIGDNQRKFFLEGEFTWEALSKKGALSISSSSGDGIIIAFYLVDNILTFSNYNYTRVLDHDFESISCFPKIISTSAESSDDTDSSSDSTDMTLSNSLSEILSYAVGGTIKGLVGTVVLQNNAGNDLLLVENKKFGFTVPILDGGSYKVTVKTQPATQTCSVAYGLGVIQGVAIDSIIVTCSVNTYSVGGELTNLNSGNTVVLQDNGSDDITLSSDGVFVFSTKVADGSPFEVTVLTQPSEQLCSVSAGSNNINGSDVEDVAINCVTNTYTVGGTLSTLGVAKTVVLQNNGGDNLELDANGAFLFSMPVSHGLSYSVAVLTQPSGQFCTVTLGTGTINSANASDITISCAPTSLKSFKTASDYGGNTNIGGITGADDKCASDANHPGEGKVYRALISDGDTRIACGQADCASDAVGQTGWVLRPDTTYYRSDGTTEAFSTNSNSIFVFTGGFQMTNAFEEFPGTYYYTGLNPDWTTGNHCQKWTVGGGFGASGHLGITHQKNTSGISHASSNCGNIGLETNLICVEQWP